MERMSDLREENQELLEEDVGLLKKIRSLPIIGRIDPKTGITILPQEEYDPEDDGLYEDL